MKATNIEWDVSDNDMTDEEMQDTLEILPKEIDIPDGMDEDAVSDYLSELTGFCVFGYVLDKIYVK